ncbi:MAG TPA: hypothetical protein VFD01_09865 [Candidatus Dormibacteraeota bacterium]|nr:hypothetical protein [Candidatus Dormibacteraeota bacterium]
MTTPIRPTPAGAARTGGHGDRSRPAPRRSRRWPPPNLRRLSLSSAPGREPGWWARATGRHPSLRSGTTPGAHGLLIEVHPRPGEALSDGAQSLDFENFARLSEEVRRLTEAMTGQPV